MSYGEKTRNPHFDTEQDEDNPIHCRGCGDYLGDADREQPIQPVWIWNGWPWCGECIKTVQPIQVDLEVASRRDIERDEMNERRR